jgi:transposase
MKKEDGRTLSSEAKYERRKQAVRLHHKGMSVKDIAAMLGIARGTVYTAIRIEQNSGFAALKPQHVGRKMGQKRQLTPEQEAHIQKLICERRPEQLKMAFALWSRAAVVLLIEQECALKMPIRSVGEYLKRWGFTPQKPIKKAYEQRPEAVKAWLNEQYPKIAKQAQAEHAEIHWIDETAVINTDVRGRCYAPKGKTPVAMVVGGTRHKLSMIASVNNRGKAQWMIIDEAFNAQKLIEFFEALIKDSGQEGKKKLYVIMDNLRVHHSKIVKAWLEENKDKMQAFYLPSYSPELNPEERLNADLKHRLGSKVQVRTKEKLRQVTDAHMHDIASQPERVKSYFGDERVAYAAVDENNS